jgi:hypothetical protein
MSWRRKLLSLMNLKLQMKYYRKNSRKQKLIFAKYCRAVKEDKDILKENYEFFVASVKRSTEETLSMERKFTDANKVINKSGTKIVNLKQTNKMLKDENDKFKSDMKLSNSEAKTTLKIVSRKESQKSSSLFSSSSESPNLHLFPDSNLQPTKKKVPQVDIPSFSKAKKTFPPMTFNSFHPNETMVSGKLFSPFQRMEIITQQLEPRKVNPSGKLS